MTLAAPGRNREVLLPGGAGSGKDPKKRGSRLEWKKVGSSRPNNGLKESRRWPF